MNEPEPTLDQLRFVRDWMKRLAEPGPKAEFRVNGVSTPQPYPEASRLQAEQALNKLDKEIARIESIKEEPNTDEPSHLPQPHSQSPA